MKNFACFIMLICALFVSACSQQKSKTVKLVPHIILDTDIGPDYDDVGAIALLHALADSGACTILATIASNQSPYIAANLSVLNTWFNRPNLPIAVVRGNAVNLTAWQKWDSVIAADYPHQLTSNKQAEDAVTLYRKILAAQPDSSVTIVTVGFFTNMANLLQSVPDTISPLTGEALIQKKVKQIVSMAGRFDSGMGSFKEFNVVKDSASAKVVFDRWPTPIVFSGFEIGMNLHTGLPLLDSSVAKSPVKDVFARCIPMSKEDANGRMSWDQTAVLVAVKGYQPYFNVVKGRIISNIDGSNGWDSTGKRDAYLVQQMPVPLMEQVLNRLMMHRPMTKHGSTDSRKER